MRITGGQARGIPLAVPRGELVRPATDALRQALFSSIAARLPAARFLDLFAGSGAYGLEALSRGAAGGLWVEKNKAAIACLERNRAAVLKSLGSVPRRPASASAELAQPAAVSAQALMTDVASPRWEPAAAALAPTLVFIDPPYEQIESIVPPLFARLHGLFAAQPGLLVVLELPGEQLVELDGWHCAKRLGGKSPRQPSLALLTPK